MITLVETYPKEWMFVFSKEFEETLDNFYYAWDLYSSGQLKEAEKEFLEILRIIPDHLDVLHYLAMLKERKGDKEGAFCLWEKAVELGKKAFPENFEAGKDKIRWSILNNRPFLRCLHAYGLSLLEKGKKDEALSIFKELILLNPEDNLGVRIIIVNLLFSFNQPEKVLKICSSYPDDITPEILYGKPLALFQIGRKKEATKHLKKAITTLPLVAKELLKKKHKKPKIYPDRVTIGGKDEAYLYWLENKEFWEKTEGSIEWLKSIYTNLHY